MDIQKKWKGIQRKYWIAGFAIFFILLFGTNPSPRNYARFAIGSPTQHGFSLAIRHGADRYAGATTLYCRKEGKDLRFGTDCQRLISWEKDQDPDFLKKYFEEKVIGRYNFFLFSIYYLDDIHEYDMAEFRSPGHIQTYGGGPVPILYLSAGILTTFLTIDVLAILAIAGLIGILVISNMVNLFRPAKKQEP